MDNVFTDMGVYLIISVPFNCIERHKMVHKGFEELLINKDHIFLGQCPHLEVKKKAGMVSDLGFKRNSSFRQKVLSRCSNANVA